jgi:hypothetical protein
LLTCAAGAHVTFLQQCVTAIASLALLADALKAAKPGLLQLLQGAGLAKEVEAYFSRTVDAAADLKEAVYMGAARRLLPVRVQHTGSLEAWALSRWRACILVQG